jgi:hypothetical protein
MNKDKHHSRQLPDTASAQREILERTMLVEDSTFISPELSSLGPAGAPVTGDNYGPSGYAVGAPKPRPQVTQHRPQGDLSDAQFQLLQNLERLTYSLQGPEESLDDTYSRPFPQIINRT